jgi:hypothetical protein
MWRRAELGLMNRHPHVDARQDIPGSLDDFVERRGRELAAVERIAQGLPIDQLTSRDVHDV